MGQSRQAQGTRPEGVGQLLINDSWVYRQLRGYGLDRRGSESDLSDLYHSTPGQPAYSSPIIGAPLPRHWASVRRFLPTEYADSLSFACNLLIGVIDRVYPPHAHMGGAQWPLPLSFMDWPYCEWLLHAETDYPGYREHVVHSLRVSALGRWLVATCEWLPRKPDKGQGILAEAVSKGPQVRKLLAILNLTAKAVDDRVVAAAWWIAGLFHDIGYSVYLFGQIEKKIAEALPWYAGDIAAGLVRGSRAETIERALFRGYLERGDVQAPPYSGKRKGWEIGLYRDSLGNHSVAGSLMLLMSLDEARAMTAIVIKINVAVPRFMLLLQKYRSSHGHYSTHFTNDKKKANFYSRIPVPSIEIPLSSIFRASGLGDA